MRNNRYPVLILFLSINILLSFISCSKRPSKVLSEDKMVDLMVDMELVEAYAGSQGLNSGEKTELGKRVLQKHGVSEEALDTTLSWYGRNLDEYAELFEKVDKEINKRRKKYAVKPDGLAANAENLWQYSEHLVLSELSGADSFSFNFPTSEIKNGEVLEFSFALPNATSLKSTLGVEYADGSGEGIVSNFSNKKSIKLSLSTDTSKKVSRIFGTLHLKEAKNLPFYIDSLQLTTQPFDSISYRSSRRNQKTFGPHIVKPTLKKVAEADSVVLKADSLINNGAQNMVVSEDLKKDSLTKEPSGKKMEKSELPHPTLQNSNNAATNRLQKAPMGADVKPGRGPSTRNPKGPRK